MRTRIRNPFLAVRTEGSILPADVLSRIVGRDKDLDGLTPESYHLAKNERINEVATRAWNRLQGAWKAFREAAERLPESDLGTTLTRERWLLILFHELGYGRLMTHRAWELDGRTYPISHLWSSTPIHLVGCRVKMDTKQAGVAGAARVSPHSLVQEFLNRSDDHLWGIVSNGLTLRLLRDNVSLTRQAYVEFDLEAMMEGEAFSDFVLLFMLCHQSRVEVPEEKTPESCWLEQWHNAAAEQGIRALDTLRQGVQQAVNALGAGFLAHPANTGLRSKLKDGTLSTQDYYRQILRVVYRLLFLFVAEDRDLLYDPDAPLANRAIYADYYSTRRIRDLAQRRRGTKHADQYRGLFLVFEKLRAGCPELALPALGSFLFSEEATCDLDTVDLANRELLKAMRRLACTTEDNTLRPIDYRNLGPEELGSVYESLLEMHPQVNTDAGTFKLNVAAGSERKTTGSYYTHSSLVQCLLDSALDPVLDETVKKPDPEKALLDLKICDPASGSGHFLIAAAHRVAKRLAAVRTGEDEPSPDATRSALRDVIGRCIYGVDINPMAVELCKISLWMEAMEPGKTLSFLDHHIKCGNSLLGTTPALMIDGIPDDAFKPIEGDDKIVCKDLKAQNKGERAGLDMFSAVTERQSRADLTASFRQLVDADDASPSARRKKAEHYRSLVHSADYENAWFLADAWCAAFVLPKTSLGDLAVTHRRFRNWEANPSSAKFDDREAVRAIATEYQFFHWHLAFPEVFRTPSADENPENEQCGWSGGFDCVLGNPPWEKINLKLEEYFQERRPEIANAQTKAIRLQMLENLAQDAPQEFLAFKQVVRFHDGLSHFLRDSLSYPRTGLSRINVYSIFAELGVQLLARSGRLGMLFPTGIATDRNNKNLFLGLAEAGRLIGVFDFENRKVFFPDIHASYRFCVFVAAGRWTAAEAKFGFFLDSADDVRNPHRVFELTAADLRLVSPESGTAPIFRDSREASIAMYAYRRHAVLSKWEAEFGAPQTPFNMANDSCFFEDFSAPPSPALLPLLEGKYIGAFNWRAAREISAGQPSVAAAEAEQLADPTWVGSTRYRINRQLVSDRYPARFRVVLRTIARATDHRTAIAALAPPVGAGHTLIQFRATAGEWALFVTACMNSFAFDFLARARMSGASLTHWIVRQIPIAAPSGTEGLLRRGFIDCRSAELCITDYEVSEAVGEEIPLFLGPYRWNPNRRFVIRCELDAAFFHLYLGTPQHWRESSSKDLLRLLPTRRDAVEHIMETFPIVKRKDEAEYGEYRTKLQILDIYARMQQAIDTGKPYQTLLDPPPGPPADEHGNFLPLPEWKPGYPKPPTWPPHIHPPKEVTEYDAT